METKKKIVQMSDLADLFLALYAINFKSEDDIIYFSKNFKMLLKKAIVESSVELSELSCYDDFLDENGNFNIDEFMEKILLSQTKKYWRDVYHYDINNDAIYTFIETKKATNIIDSYDENNVNIVNTMLENYLLFEECNDKNEDASINTENRKYIKLLEMKKSND